MIKLKQIWNFIKKYVWVVVGAIIIFLGKLIKNKWFEMKVKKVKEKQEEIKQEEQALSKLKDDYEKLKEVHDEEIKKAKEESDPSNIDDIDVAESILADLLNRLRK